MEDIKHNERYILIKNYAVKCRMYPSKEQAALLDIKIHAAHAAYNIIMHDMCINHNCVIEKQNDDGTVVHFPDWYTAVNAEYKNKLIEQYSIIGCLPAGAIVGRNGIVSFDMKRAFTTCYQNEKNLKSVKIGISNPVEIIEADRAYNKSLKNRPGCDKKPKKRSVPNYYSRSRPRKSYTYQEGYTKFIFYKEDLDKARGIKKKRKKDDPKHLLENQNVLYMNLQGVGVVKVRGFNFRLKFQHKDADKELVTFLEFAELNKKSVLSVTVTKDTCGDYFLVFKFPEVFKPMKINQVGEIGVDVGEINPIVTSDGVKFPALDFSKYNRKNDKLQRQLSRRQGFASQEFREKRKQYKEETGEFLQPSKRYLATQLKKNLNTRNKLRYRDDAYNKYSCEVSTKYRVVATETLGNLKVEKEREVEPEREEEKKA